MSNIFLVGTIIQAGNPVILGSYNSLEEAKNSIESHARLFMTNQVSHLNIYKIELDSHIVYRFKSDDIKNIIENIKHIDILVERSAQGDQTPLVDKIKENFKNTKDVLSGKFIT